MSKKKIILITVLALVGAILLSALGYVIYVFCSYYRIEDHQKLEVKDGTAEIAPVGEKLTLMTYNIGFGAYSADYSFFMDGGEHARAFSKEAVETNTRGALGLIAAREPDMIFFQEVDVDGTRSYHVDQYEMLKKDLTGYDSVFAQNYDSPYFIYPFNQPIGANRSGMVTFSGFDIEGSERRSLPIEESLFKLLDLDRAYTKSEVKAEDGKKLILYNVHLSAYTSDGTIADEQMEMLADDMEAEYKKGNYIIAGGDFNKDLLGDSGEYFTRTEGEFTWAKPLKTDALPEGFTVHSGKNAPTCRNADSPYRADGTDFILSVDGFIVSPNVEVELCETVSSGFAYSDHDPVKLEFVLISAKK